MVKQGDVADAFYIVKSGVLACSVRKNADNEAGGGETSGESRLQPENAVVSKAPLTTSV